MSRTQAQGKWDNRPGEGLCQPRVQISAKQGGIERLLIGLSLNTTQHCSHWGSHLCLKANLEAEGFQGLTKEVCPARLRLYLELLTDPHNSVNTATPRWHIPTAGPSKPAVVIIILTSNHNPSQYHKPTLCQRTESSGPSDHMI